MLYPVSLVYLVTDMTSQVANLLNISNMKLELIKQNVDWYIANCFKFKTINICLQSFLSSRLSPSNPAVWEYSLCFLWSECDCPLGWGSRLYSFRAMPCLSDNYTIYCLSWSGCDVSAGCLWKTTQIFFNCTILWLCLPVWFLYTNVLRVFRFLYFPFRLKSHFLLAFSESRWSVSARTQRYNPVCNGFAHAQLSVTAMGVATWKQLIHFSIVFWHLSSY